MGLICCFETSVSSYQSTLCNFAEEGKSHSYRGRSLKSRNVKVSAVLYLSISVQKYIDLFESSQASPTCPFLSEKYYNENGHGIFMEK